MNSFKAKMEKFLKWFAMHPLINRLTVTRKIVVAYLLIALFSLTAIVYAMSSLHRQMTISTNLVHKDVKSVAMTRDLQGSLASQERLQKQYLLLKKSEILDLLLEKYEAFPDTWNEFIPLLDTDKRDEISATYGRYRVSGDTFNQLLTTGKPADKYYKDEFLPAHLALFESIATFRENQQQKIDAGLASLAESSGHSFQITFLLLLLGFILATPVAISVILGIHHSLHHLTRATHQIGDGNYDVDLKLSGNDEFSLLADEFLQMGRKLQELEAANLDASPLTHLPGNLMIQRRVDELLRDGVSFAHAFVDLDHFKAYNDRYGYQNGSDIIAIVGDIIKNIVTEQGNEDDFIGHIGGDDYIFLTSPDKVESLAKQVIVEFEAMIPDKYSEEDRRAGFFVCQDRFGVERQFPLMTISIAIICSDTSNYDSAIAISHECAKMKEHLKRMPGSNYLIDRRRGKS